MNRQTSAALMEQVESATAPAEAPGISLGALLGDASSAWLRLAASGLDRLLGIGVLDRLYRRHRLHGLPPFEFAARTLEALDISLAPAGGPVALPASGPVLVVCNHPYGGVEALALMKVLSATRTDVKFLANAGLGVFRESRPLFIGTTLLPVFFHGGNSPLFHRLGALWHRARLLLLPREFLGLRGRDIRFEIGRAVPAEALRHMDAECLTQFARAMTYLLEDPPVTATVGEASPQAPLASLNPPARVAAEVAALPASQRLLDYKHFSVYHARAPQIPLLMEDIARERERVFRLHDEGSGQPRDGDDFDARYTQLFVWDHQGGSLVGAYRMGHADELRAGGGGTYLARMFNFAPAFHDGPPMLEMGRSFVVPEHQKNYYALYLLWQGIGRYLAAHPRYRRLYGTVSLSRQYDGRAIALMCEALIEPSPHVRPRHPLPDRLHPEGRAFLASRGGRLDLATLSAYVRGIDGKDVPILLKHYHKLGARFHTVGVDPNFNATPGLMLSVDMDAMPEKLVATFLGEHAAAYLAHANEPHRPPLRHRRHPLPAAGHRPGAGLRRGAVHAAPPGRAVSRHRVPRHAAPPMCTLSWQPFEDGYRLWFNRDERRDRPPAAPPAPLWIDGMACLAPRDGAGGTWLLVNARGVALALLNLSRRGGGHARRTPLPGPDSPGLRGQCQCRRGSGLLRGDGFGRLAPLPPGCRRCRRGGPADLGRPDAGPGPSPDGGGMVTSSSWRPEAVVQARRAAFRRLVGDLPGAAPQRLEAFHRHRCAEPAAGIRMARPDACTHSIARIEVSWREGVARFRYEPRTEIQPVPPVTTTRLLLEKPGHA